MEVTVRKCWKRTLAGGGTSDFPDSSIAIRIPCGFRESLQSFLVNPGFQKIQKGMQNRFPGPSELIGTRKHQGRIVAELLLGQPLLGDFLNSIQKKIAPSVVNKRQSEMERISIPLICDHLMNGATWEIHQIAGSERNFTIKFKIGMLIPDVNQWLFRDEF